MIETLIALSILAIGLTITSVVIAGSLQNMRVARDRVIATQLAREGMEAIRNIRDTNWIKFSNNRRGCWNHYPGATALLDQCDGSDPILPGNYIVYKNDEFRWKLDSPTTQEEIDATRLNRMDIDDELDSDLDGDPGNDHDFYNHALTTHNDPLGTSVQSSLFQRMITVEYLENIPDLDNESIDTPQEWAAFPNTNLLNRMRVTSTVTWQGSLGLHTVQLKTILTDYLGRSQLGE